MDIVHDLRYALRTLANAPGFAVTATLTLALAIGGSTAIFTVVDSVLLRPLRFAEPQRLTTIWTTLHSRVPPAYLHDWRLESRTFEDIAGWFDVRANLTGRGEPVEVLADRVTPNFFDVLGTRAVLGRTFTVTASFSHVEPEVILSHGFWQRRFGSDPNIVGQPITLDGETLTIVGVMPEGLTVRTVELSESRAEMWMPLPLIPGDRTSMWGILNIVGRLARHATVTQAQTELSLIARRIEGRNPSDSRDLGVEVTPLLDATVQDVRLTLLVLLGAVGIVLLVACANVGNLVLSRAATRQTELAIRRSLGATAGRLVRQFLTESLVLATAGGALGVLLAVWGTELLVSALPAGLDLPRTREIGVDLRILVFASILTLLAAILVGLVPILSSISSAPQPTLGASARGSSLFTQGRKQLSGILVISEVAFTLILLAGAGLLVRSFLALSFVNPGFQAEQVVTMRTTLPAAKYDTNERIRAFSGELLDRIEKLPGVDAVGFVNYLPMSRFGAAGSFEIEGRPTARPVDRPGSWFSIVGGDYFGAMGIPLLRGRLPGDADTEKTQAVFVIDDTLARRYWSNADPIGTRVIWSGNENEKLVGEIIGVVGGVRWGGVAASPQATTYFWLPQRPERQLTMVVRTPGDPIKITGAIAAEVGDIDPNQPIAEIRAMQDFVSADIAQPRFTMLLLGSFAAAALLLATVGLYGVIAFNVTQRTQEIGVRVALGARQRDVLQLVLQRGMLLAGIGLAIGIVVTLALGRVVAGMLHGVSPADPATLVAVSAFLAAVAMLASYLPARRAARVDPLVALRYE